MAWELLLVVAQGLSQVVAWWMVYMVCLGVSFFLASPFYVAVWHALGAPPSPTKVVCLFRA